MPIRPENRGRYPADWLVIRARILSRADNRCEWCGLPNYAVGIRYPDGRFVPAHGNRMWDAAGRGELPYRDARALAAHANEQDAAPAGRYIVVVLTVAHVHDPDPSNCDPRNLAAVCQRCHNRHDAYMRAAHAAATRRVRAGADFFSQDASEVLRGC